MTKNNVILFLSLMISVAVYGQSESNPPKNNSFAVYPRNEIRVNLLSSVLGIPEINYEYFPEDNFGVGLTAGIGIDNNSVFNIKAELIPYGRLYFGNKPGAGFYIEGSTGLIVQNVNVNSATQTQNGFGIGVAIGYKFLTRNNWVGDITYGAGRVFGTNTDSGFPRFGISIGKKF